MKHVWVGFRASLAVAVYLQWAMLKVAVVHLLQPVRGLRIIIEIHQSQQILAETSSASALWATAGVLAGGQCKPVWWASSRQDKAPTYF